MVICLELPTLKKKIDLFENWFQNLNFCLLFGLLGIFYFWSLNLTHPINKWYTLPMLSWFIYFNSLVLKLILINNMVLLYQLIANLFFGSTTDYIKYASLLSNTFLLYIVFLGTYYLVTKWFSEVNYLKF